MQHSHRPAPRASRSVRALTGAQQSAEGAAASFSRTSEGPVPAWAPEAKPSDVSPTAHTQEEPLGSPSLRRSVRPVRWSDPVDVNAWLGAVRASFDDLAALSWEGSVRAKHRVLSRAELRRQTREAERSLVSLFEAADAGLTELASVKGGKVE
jgi:hypothetical protein